MLDRSFARQILSLLVGLLFGLAAASAGGQQATAKFEISGQIDPDKVPSWLAGAARMSGSVSIATAEERITIVGDKYVVDSTATGASFLSKFFDNLRVVRRSEGSWVKGVQATTRFYEKRGSSEAATALIDYRAGTAHFSRGSAKPSKNEPIRFMTSDTAALPFAFLGRARPTGTVTFAYTDGRFLRTLTVDPTVVFNHSVAGKPVPAVRYVSRRLSPKDAEVELWIRAEDGFPLRLRLSSARYGVRGEANLTELPPVFKRQE